MLMPEQIRDELEGDPGQGHYRRVGHGVGEDRGVRPGGPLREERQVRLFLVSPTRLFWSI